MSRYRFCVQAGTYSRYDVFHKGTREERRQIVELLFGSEQVRNLWSFGSRRNRVEEKTKREEEEEKEPEVCRFAFCLWVFCHFSRLFSFFFFSGLTINFSLTKEFYNEIDHIEFLPQIQQSILATPQNTHQHIHQVISYSDPAQPRVLCCNFNHSRVRELHDLEQTTHQTT